MDVMCCSEQAADYKDVISELNCDVLIASSDVDAVCARCATDTTVDAGTVDLSTLVSSFQVKRCMISPWLGQTRLRTCSIFIIHCIINYVN